MLFQHDLVRFSTSESLVWPTAALDCSNIRT